MRVAAQPAALRRLAVDIARAAGAHAYAGQQLVTAVDVKSSSTDLVTEFDCQAEAILVDAIVAQRPGDGIVGEEGAAVTSDTGLVWYLDPIDGTTNFVHGHPMWATSVAVGDESGMLAGAVYAPALGEMFSASRHAGATLQRERSGDDVPITASRCERLELAVVATGFSYDAGRRLAQSRRVAALIDRVADVRRGGSAALDLCFTAAGRVDAYFEEYLNIWDLAAGELIAREAGCESGPVGGSADAPGLCVAPPALFQAVAELVAATG